MGREIECGITLEALQVSRYHAKIVVEERGIHVEDVHSSNGTFVNGRQIAEKTALHLGDEVAFDDLSFRVTWLESGQADETVQVDSQSLGVDQVAKIRAASAEHQARVLGVSQSENPPSEVDADLGRPHKVHEKPDIESIVPEPSGIEPELPLVNESTSGQQGQSAVGVSSRDAIDEVKRNEFIHVDDDDESTKFLSLKKMDQYVATNRQFHQAFDSGSGYRLVATTAPIRGKVFPLESDEVVKCWSIGREENADICVKDTSVSREHAWLSKLESVYQRKAAHNTNGILVNGQSCMEATLKQDDRLQIGRLEFVFKTGVGVISNDGVNLTESNEKAPLSIDKTVAALVFVIVILLGIVAYLLV